MRFLGMTGFYRQFCPNFSSTVCPLTDLLQRKTKFDWTKFCNDSICKIKSILMSSPVLSAPDFSKQIKLTVDASDVGIGVALFQEHDDNVIGLFLIFPRNLLNVNRIILLLKKSVLPCC